MSREHRNTSVTRALLETETMSDDLVEALRSCRYMFVLMDGSTDSSVTEKEPF